MGFREGFYGHQDGIDWQIPYINLQCEAPVR